MLPQSLIRTMVTIVVHGARRPRSLMESRGAMNLSATSRATPESVRACLDKKPNSCGPPTKQAMICATPMRLAAGLTWRRLMWKTAIDEAAIS